MLKQSSLGGFFKPKPTKATENSSPQDSESSDSAAVLSAPAKPQPKTDDTSKESPETAGGASKVLPETVGNASKVSPAPAKPGKKPTSPATKRASHADLKGGPSSSKRPSPTAAHKKSPAKKKIKPEKLPIPAALPCLVSLPAEAKAAVLIVSQMVTVFSELIGLPRGAWSEERLAEALVAEGAAAAAAAAGGALAELHVALLRCLFDEDARYLYEDHESDVDYEDEGEKDFPRPWPLVSGGTAAPGLTLVYADSHAPKLKDVAALLDTLTWPEALRQVVIHYCSTAPPKRRNDRDPFSYVHSDLVPVAAELRENEYARLPVVTKALALQSLCERVLTRFHQEIDAAYGELDTEESQSKKEEKASKREEKQRMVELKKACAEAWSVLEDKELAVKAAETAWSAAALKVHTEAVKTTASKRHLDEAKAKTATAKTALEAARHAYQVAKARRDGTPLPKPSSADVPATAGTSRQQQIRAAAEVEKAERARAKRLAEVREAKLRRMQQAAMVRLRPAGRDRDGSWYWLLPCASAAAEEEAAAAADHELPARECKLYVESKDRAWGEVADLEGLRKALRTSDHPDDAKLLAQLKGAPPLKRTAELLQTAGAGVPPRRAPIEREPDSSDDEDEEAQIRAAQAAAQAALDAAKPDAAGMCRQGHDWVGRRVRLLSDDDEAADGTITGWWAGKPDAEPAPEAEPAPMEVEAATAAAADDAVGIEGKEEPQGVGAGAAEASTAGEAGQSESSEVRELGSDDGERAEAEANAAPAPLPQSAAADGAGATTSWQLPAHLRMSAQHWQLTLDSGETRVLDEAEVEAGLQEMRDAPLKVLKRLLQRAAEEGEFWNAPEAMEVAEEKDGEAEGMEVVEAPPSREEWDARVEEAADAAALRGALAQLAASAKLPAGDGLANWATWRRDWRRRLDCSATVAQLAVRLAELEATAVERNGLLAGQAIEVALQDDDGKGLEWFPAQVTSVWRDGSFRVLVRLNKTDPPYTEDYLCPTSKAGRKEKDKEWRKPREPPRERAKRSFADAPADGPARGKRDAARRAQAARSFVDAAGEGTPGGTDDEDEGSSGRRSPAGADESRPPAMGEAVEVKVARKWVAAEVVRLFRAGSFEAKQPDGAKGKYELDDFQETWRVPNEAGKRGGRRKS